LFTIAITLGLILLIGLSVGAGMVLRRERDRHIGLRLDARRRALWLWEQELLSAAAARSCPSCDLLRRRVDLQRPLTG